jgi:hypothetical protein
VDYRKAPAISWPSLKKPNSLHQNELQIPEQGNTPQISKLMEFAYKIRVSEARLAPGAALPTVI